MEDHELVIQTNFAKLVEVINCAGTTLWDELISRGVFPPGDVSYMRGTPTKHNRDQVRDLLERMRQCSSQQFELFVEALRGTRQERAVSLLTGGHQGPGAQMSSPLSPAAKDKHQRNIKEVQRKLCNYIKMEYSKVDMFAWHSGGHPVDLDKIYVPIRTATYHRTANTTEKVNLQQYTDLFQIGQEKPPRTTTSIVAIAKPLGGKTTLTKKISSDWERSVNGQLQDSNLAQYTLLLPVILGLVKQGTGLSPILNMPFLTEDDVKAIEETLQAEPERVLFLLDGLDEFAVSNSPELVNIMKGYTYPGCTVLITTRAEGMIKLQKHRPTIEAKIEEFDDKQIQEFVQTYFACEDSSFYKFLLKLIFSSQEVHKMAKNPGQLDMLCLLWHQNEKDINFNDRVELFKEIVQFSLKVAENKLNPTSHCPKEDLLSHYEGTLLKFGKLAYQYEEAKLADHSSEKKVVRTMRTVFRMQDVKVVVGEDAMKYGFLCKSHTVSRWQESDVSFIHKTVQEWLAAFYIAHNEQELQQLQYASVEDLVQDTSMHGFLLSFCKDIIESCHILSKILLPHLACIFKVDGYKGSYDWLYVNKKYFTEVLLKCRSEDKVKVDNQLLLHYCLGLMLGMLVDMPEVKLSFGNRDELSVLVYATGDVQLQTQHLVIQTVMHPLQGGGQKLGRLLCKMPHCTQLDVSECGLEEADVAAMVEVTRGHQLSIQHLDIGNPLSKPIQSVYAITSDTNSNLQGAGEALGELLLNMLQFTQLDVSGCRLEAADVAAMVEVTRGHQLGIQHLNMPGNNLQGGGAALGKLLLNMPRCTQLDVSDCGLDAPDVAALVEVTRGHQLGIQHLNIGNPLPDSYSMTYAFDEINRLKGGGAALGELLLNMPQCTQLDVSGCGLNAADLQAFEAGIQKEVDIKQLDLSENDFSGAGAAVGQLLLKLVSCHILSLQECSLTTSDMRAAAAAIHGAHIHTEQLCLQGNDISDEEADDLMRLPELSFLTFK